MGPPEPLNILIVDDRTENMMAMELLLDEPDYNVFKAVSGQEALGLTLEHDFALVLLDVQMPEMDGFEVARLMRGNSRTRHVPIIFVTALNKEEKHVSQGYEAGAVDYLFKPVIPEILRGKVSIFAELYRQKMALEGTTQDLMLAVDELARLNDRLENMVEERTAELLASNNQLQQEVHEHRHSKNMLRESHDRLELTLEELKQTQAQMIQTEKMVSIGQLAAGVAHEINNPTAFVSSNLHTLSEYQDDMSRVIAEYRSLVAGIRESTGKDGIPPASREQVKRIGEMEDEVDIELILEDIPAMIEETKEGTERIKKIVLDLKDFAHPGEDEARFADINKCIDATLNIVWNEIKYKATVEKEYGDLPEVKCFSQQLGQVFVNLLVNAAHAIDEKGEIRISTRSVDEQVEIRISDTGNGISEENLARIFDPFFTTKEVGKGTGLGLNVVYNIIQKHQGTIQAESKEGEGTTFSIQLPIEPNLELAESQDPAQGN